MKHIYRNDANLENLGIDFESLVKELRIDDITSHRKGSSFYTSWVIQILKCDFPELPNEYFGTWITDDFMTDDVYGNDYSTIQKLTRVEKKEKIIKKTVWVEVSEK